MTYHDHHQIQLNIKTSTYNPYLLVTDNKGILLEKLFNLLAIQTDNTLTVCTKEFSDEEEKKLKESGLREKPKMELTPDISLGFNGTETSIDNKNNIYMRAKGQGDKIKLINPDKPNYAQRYAKQRARGAYIASIC